MKISINGELVFTETYQTWDTLMAEYTKAETEEGRQVPSYDPISIGVSLGLFVLGQAIAYYERRKGEKAAKQRQDQILAELKSLRDLPSSKQAEQLKQMIKREGLSVSVNLETDAERDLQPAIDNILAKDKTDSTAPKSPGAA